MTMAASYPFLFLLKITGWLTPLWERAKYTEIGFSGHVSMPDENIAEERKLKPLNRLEKWLLKPLIEDEQNLRRDAFRQAMIDVLGEDPEADWP